MASTGRDWRGSRTPPRSRAMLAMGRQCPGKRVQQLLGRWVRLRASVGLFPFRRPNPGGISCRPSCRVRHCVNPNHLEAVTPAENARRRVPWLVSPTHCPRGHPYDERNTYFNAKGHRFCRACRNDKQKGQVSLYWGYTFGCMASRRSALTSSP